MTGDEAVWRLVKRGVDEDAITPKLLRMARRNRFVFRNEWIDANPDAPLAIFAKTGKTCAGAARKDALSTSNTSSISQTNSAFCFGGLHHGFNSGF